MAQDRWGDQGNVPNLPTPQAAALAALAERGLPNNGANATAMLQQLAAQQPSPNDVSGQSTSWPLQSVPTGTPHAPAPASTAKNPAAPTAPQTLPLFIPNNYLTMDPAQPAELAAQATQNGASPAAANPADSQSDTSWLVPLLLGGAGLGTLGALSYAGPSRSTPNGGNGAAPVPTSAPPHTPSSTPPTPPVPPSNTPSAAPPPATSVAPSSWLDPNDPYMVSRGNPTPPAQQLPPPAQQLTAPPSTVVQDARPANQTPPVIKQSGPRAPKALPTPPPPPTAPDSAWKGFLDRYMTNADGGISAVKQGLTPAEETVAAARRLMRGH